MNIRPVEQTDFDEWLALWDGYNKFYERTGKSALDEKVTTTTWARFFDPDEPIFAMVAEENGQLVGLVHFLFHRSTSRLELTCYLQDLFTLPSERGKGVGRALIEAVSQRAQDKGIKRVYWQTHETNAPGRRLYDSVAENQGFIVYVLDRD